MIVMGDHANRKYIRTDQHRHQLVFRFRFLLSPPLFASRIAPHLFFELLPQSLTLSLSSSTCISICNPAFSLQVLLSLNAHSHLRLHRNLPTFSALHHRPRTHSRPFDRHDFALPDDPLRPIVQRHAPRRPKFMQFSRLKCSKTGRSLMR